MAFKTGQEFDRVSSNWRRSQRPEAVAQTAVKEPKTLEEYIAKMMGSKNPIKQAAGIQGQALQNVIPMFQPYQETGLEAYEQFAQGSTPEGLDAILSQIMGGNTFGSLIDERTRSMEGMLSAGGLTRSGEALDQAAQLPVDVALALEALLSGRQGALADTGYGATSNIADLTTGVGEAIASGILGAEAQSNANSQASKDRRSNLMGSIIGGVASAFSDPTLKTNITKIDEIGPLGVYTWEWIPELKGSFAEKMPTKGFLSTQVREHFPDRVKTFGGFDMIDYGNLIEDLKCLS